MHVQYAIQVLQGKINEIEFTLGYIGEIPLEYFEEIQAKKHELLRAIEHLQILEFTSKLKTTKND